MASKRIALLIAIIVVFSILAGTAVYYNHYSKVKAFRVLPTQNFSSSGISTNFVLPMQVSVQTHGLKEVGSAWIKLSGSDMQVNGYLLAYYNTTGNTLDFVSIISQKAINNFSIPDKESSQSIMNGIYSLPAYYDARSTFVVMNSSIIQFLPGNFVQFPKNGYGGFELTNTPFLAGIDLNTSGTVSVQFPIIPNDVIPVRETMHHSIWTYYDTSTASQQKNLTFYFVSGISTQAVKGNNTINWDLSATYLTSQGIFTNNYNVYNLNYTITVSVP